MSDELSEPLQEFLAHLERDLDLIRQGLALAGVKPCSRCGRFFRTDDAAALFDAGQLVCYNCIHTWWPARSPMMEAKDREFTEHKLVRWLLNHHHAVIVNRPNHLPPNSDFRLVTACEECEGTGFIAKNHCHYCDGRGTVWVVIPNGAS